MSWKFKVNLYLSLVTPCLNKVMKYVIKYINIILKGYYNTNAFTIVYKILVGLLRFFLILINNNKLIIYLIW